MYMCHTHIYIHINTSYVHEWTSSEVKISWWALFFCKVSASHEREIGFKFLELVTPICEFMTKVLRCQKRAKPMKIYIYIYTYVCNVNSCYINVVYIYMYHSIYILQCTCFLGIHPDMTSIQMNLSLANVFLWYSVYQYIPLTSG